MVTSCGRGHEIYYNTFLFLVNYKLFTFLCIALFMAVPINKLNF